MLISLEEGSQATIVEEEGLLEANEEDTTTTLNQYVKYVVKLLFIVITCLKTTTWGHF